MQNYGKLQAKDRTDEVYVGIPLPFPALATLSVENAVVSSVTNLNPNTTVIEVTATAAAAALKWTTATATASVITAAGTANCDAVVAPNTTRMFVVPRNTQALSSGYSSIVGLNVQEGLYNAVAIKTTQIGSVLLTQY